MLELMESCSLCPRNCGVNRLEGETGFCGIGRKTRVASFNSHFGEESPLVGTYGSGTIFLSGCNLKCSFCQNYEISHLNEGVNVEPEQMAAMMLHLAGRGCHNINFVTPSHQVPQILEALILAISQGLNIPLVYNSSGYDSLETLRFLNGIFDIYMPDFKFWDDKWSNKFCEGAQYRHTAQKAVTEMHRQVGDLVMDEQGIAVRGLLVRHLVMPNHIAGTADIMAFLADKISANTYTNVMDQYHPCGKADEDVTTNRRLTEGEYNEALSEAKQAGIIRFDSRDRSRIVLMPEINR